MVFVHILLPMQVVLDICIFFWYFLPATKSKQIISYPVYFYRDILSFVFDFLQPAETLRPRPILLKMKQVSSIAISRKQRQNNSRAYNRQNATCRKSKSRSAPVSNPMLPWGSIDRGRVLTFWAKERTVGGHGWTTGDGPIGDSLANDRRFPSRRRSPQSRKYAGAALAPQHLANPGPGDCSGGRCTLSPSQLVFFVSGMKWTTVT
jgi:hypothetical protein